MNINAENFWSKTKAIFSTKVIGNYNPLTIWTFGLENYFISLDNPSAWHRNNILLHLLCVLLVFLISRKLGLGLLAVGLVALIFGTHPMRVESVSWITERKDVLFASFYFAAIYLYIRDKISSKYYLVISIYILFILSLLSKIQAVSLPLSLICIDILLDKKINWKQEFEKWFYFLIALIAGALAIFFLQEQGSLDTNSEFAIFQRVFIGSFALQDYSRCIQLEPSNAEYYNSRGKLYFNNKSNSQDSLILALKDYTKAIELDPNKADFWTNRGATYARLKDKQKALKDLDRGINLNPKFLNA